MIGNCLLETELYQFPVGRFFMDRILKILNYYNDHSTKEVLEYFSLCSVELEEIVNKLGFKPSHRGGHKLMILSNMANKERGFLAVAHRISKEELVSYYITENHRYEETIHHFGITEDEFWWLLNYYDCKKPKSKSNELSKHTCVEKYGDANYNNRIQAANTCMTKYGVDNVAKLPDMCDKGYATKCLNNGYDNPNNWKKGQATRIQHYGSLEESYRQCHEKYTETCLNKYGVENAAQLSTVKDKIRNSLEATFEEKYGSTCYWTTEGAVRSRGSSTSTFNEHFATLLDNHKIHYDREFSLRKFIYDFKVGKTLIEINPTPTHNITWSPKHFRQIDKNYHNEKTKNAESAGYRCIHIWDWDDAEKIITQLILPKARLYARNCVVKEVTLSEAKSFIQENHLQGYAKDTIRLGLYYNDALVSIMTFGKPRYNKNYEYELIRYCSSHTIVGGAEKLFKHFLKEYSPKSIISYCDRNKFEGNVYKKLGFSYKNTNLSTHWYHMSEKIHILDSLLRARGFDQLLGDRFGKYGKGTSNKELMYAHGFVEIVDAGQSVYIYNVV